MIPVAASKVADQLGGKRVLGTGVSTFEGLRKAVERGLPQESIAETLTILPQDVRNLILSQFDGTTQAGVLDSNGSERLERIARTIAQALRTFSGDKADAVTFLSTPNRNLGNERPIRRALSELGARQVEDLLVKISYGFPS